MGIAARRPPLKGHQPIAETGVYISFATRPLFQAGAGISAWAGALQVEILTGTVREKCPLFAAIKQLMSHLDGYESVERVAYADERIRVGHPIVRKLQRRVESRPRPADHSRGRP